MSRVRKHDELRDAEEMFFAEFNRRLEDMACGTRVAALADDRQRMAIIDLDGSPLGIVGRDLNPSVFCDFMLLVEEAFAEGVAFGRSYPHVSSSSAITVQ